MTRLRGDPASQRIWKAGAALARRPSFIGPITQTSRAVHRGVVVPCHLDERAFIWRTRARTPRRSSFIWGTKNIQHTVRYSRKSLRVSGTIKRREKPMNIGD